MSKLQFIRVYDDEGRDIEEGRIYAFLNGRTVGMKYWINSNHDHCPRCGQWLPTGNQWKHNPTCSGALPEDLVFPKLGKGLVWEVCNDEDDEILTYNMIQGQFNVIY